MSKETSKPASGGKGSPAPVERAQPNAEPPVPSAGSATPTRVHFFRPCDWISFGITTLLVFIGYYLTLAPDLTLEDSGELAVGSFYAGVPHPPGYPVWTLYTWLFTVLVPVSNIAWRVALSSAVAAALASGFIALITSRGSSMILESMKTLAGYRRQVMAALILVTVMIPAALGLEAIVGMFANNLGLVRMVQFLIAPLLGGVAAFTYLSNTPRDKADTDDAEAGEILDRTTENRISIVAGWVAGMLIGFNGTMWSQAVIVEVYTFSVLSLVLTFVFLMRWLYEPDRTRWLALTALMFGICFTNHQTLICAAMGIEVLIAFARPRLGRLLFLVNAVFYFAGLLLKATETAHLFQDNKPVFIIFNVVGVASLQAFIWMCSRMQRTTRAWLVGAHALINLMLIWVAMRQGSKISDITLATWMLWVNPVFLFGTYGVLKLSNLAEWPVNTWKPVITMVVSGLAFLFGVSFYAYMPLASMTNPPMNWGYPRTLEGFIHAFTRGQYEKTNPTDSLGKFAEQCWMLLEGAIDEFNPAYLLVALLPLIFLLRMRQRERAWVAGQVAIYMCLSFLLVFLLNPQVDRQSVDLTRVFFTSAHVTIALFAGYGIAVIGGILHTRYREYRQWLLFSGAVLSAIALYDFAWEMEESAYWLDRFNGFFALALLATVTGMILLRREKASLILFLGLAAISPLYSVMAHWSTNEQRGHLFGWWFGHDMFTPPFKDPATRELSYDPDKRRELLANPEQAKLVYPEMARDAVLFGGTDPGRFCPTYMIFCESFIKPEQRRDPHFDRRDVYIITQNALADHTYLSYIRAHYNRSTQKDPPFFQSMFLTERQRADETADQQWKLVERKTLPKLLLLSAADRVFTDIGARIEERRRKEGVYPPNEIHTPTPVESAVSFESYLQDAGRRKQLNQLRPGEIVDIVRGPEGKDRIQVAGQVSVMAINALLAKIIFDENPTNEFYVEESFPLEWMFPHLTPFGIIMKINREPVPEYTEEIFQRDREFWKDYSQRLIGDWITEETTVKELCDFSRKVYIRRDYDGFEGDPKFIRDDQAQKSFSKLRGAIAGTYLWRLNWLSGLQTPPEYHPKTEEARLRLIREAEFAWKQAFAFCPYSPEAVFKYAQLLLQLNGRLDDARLIAETALEFDPNNDQFQYLLSEINRYKENEVTLGKVQTELGKLVAQYQSDPTNITNAFSLVSAYVQLQQTDAAAAVLDMLLTQSNVTPDAVVQTALLGQQLRNIPLMERALERLIQVNPNSPEAWYDLAAMQAALGKHDRAMTNIRQSILLSDERLRTVPGAKDLRTELPGEARFAPLRNRPDWQTNFQF